MRKILSLVLVLSLVLGSFSFAFAAPADVEGTDYEDAVTRLSALEILSGFPDGTFRPNETITRAQFAKIMVTALGVGEAAKYAAGETKFADVPANHWAAGYINVASDMGIINGYGNGNFGPEDQVTYAQAVTMIVRGLGYEPKAQAMGGYPGGYLAVAAEKEITEDITLVDTLAATRGDVALMVDASLEVPMMVQKTWGQYPEYEEDEDQTLLSKLGIDEIDEVVVTDIPRTNSKLDDDEIKLNGKTYTVLADVDFELIFGQEVTVFADGDDIISLSIDSDYFFDAIEVADDELTLVDADVDYDFAEEVLVYINGDEKDVDKLATNYDYAKVVLNSDEEVAFIDAWVWDGFLVVEEIDDYQIFAYGEELDVEDFTIVKDGETITVEDIEEDDILFYNEDAEYAEVFNNSVKGEMEKVYVGSFEVADEEFDYATAYYLDGDELAAFTDEEADDMKEEGGEVAVFMDRSGNAVFVVGELGEAETTSFYAYVTAETTDFDSRADVLWTLDVVNEEGEEVNYDVDLTEIQLVVNGVAYTTDEQDESTDGTDSTWTNVDDDTDTETNLWENNIAKGKIVEIEVDEDGDIESVTVLSAKESNNDPSDVYFETDDKYVNGNKLLSSAVVFNVEEFTTDADDVEVAELSELDYDEIIQGAIYVNSDDEIIVIVVEESDKETETTKYDAVAVADSAKVSGEDTWRLKLNIDGEEDTYYTEEDANTANADDVREGDFLEVEIDDETNEVITVTRVLSGNAKFKTIVVDEDQLSVRDEEVNGYFFEDAVILDGEDDFEELNIRDLKDGDKLELLLVNSGSKYVVFAVRVDQGEESEDDGEIEFDYSYTTGTPDTLTITVSNAVYSDEGDNVYNVKVTNDVTDDVEYATATLSAEGADLVFTVDAHGTANYSVVLFKDKPSDAVATDEKFIIKE